MKLRIPYIAKVMLASVLSILFVGVGTTFAGDFGLSNVADSGIGLSNDVSIIEIIARIIRVLLGLLGIVVVGLFIYAGFIWMTANGNADKIETAKKIMTNAVIGLVIIFSSFAITSFVISRLSEATNSGSVPTDRVDPPRSSCDPGSVDYSLTLCEVYCRLYPLDDICFDRDFYVTSITPSTDGDGLATNMNNIQIRVIFSKPISPSSLDAAVQLTLDDAIVPATFILEAHTNKLIHIVPEDDLKNGTYTVTVNNELVDVTGDLIDMSYTDRRGDVFVAETNFTVDRDFEDDRQPELTELTLNGSAGEPILFIGDILEVAVTTQDRNSDPPYGGIGYVDIRMIADASIPHQLLGPRVRDEGRSLYGSSEVYSTSYRQAITRELYTAGERYRAHVSVQDLQSDLVNASVGTSRYFTVYEWHCNNGVQDEDETGIDTGGACGGGEGENCTTDAQCSPYMQCINSVCTPTPIILDIDPEDAATDNWVTVLGRNFGDTDGIIEFGVTQTDGTLEWIPAARPSLDVCPVSDLWHDTWVIVAVPDSIPAGAQFVLGDEAAIRIVTAGGDSASDIDSDDTLNDRGPNLTFTKSNVDRPGLCAVSTLRDGDIISANVGEPGTPAYAFGQGFAAGETIPFWGGIASEVVDFASSNLIETRIPNGLTAGTVGVYVRQGTEGPLSNGIPFIIETNDSEENPDIITVDPEKTTNGSFVTLSGTNFGESTGMVYLGNSPAEVRACAAGNPEACISLVVELPQQCVNTWRNTEVIVQALDDGSEIPEATYSLLLQTASGRVTDGNDLLTVNDGPALPSLCAITPNSGPAPLAVGETISLAGIGFGDTSSHNVRFWNTGASTTDPTFAGWFSDAHDESGTTIESYTDTGIETRLPVHLSGVQEGLSIPQQIPTLIRIEDTVNSSMSNAVTYTADTCSEDTAPDGYQCCTLGVDAGKLKPEGLACAGDLRTAGYTWRFASGIIPSAPYVVQSCEPGNLPTPSPTDARSSGEQACTNALVVVQFSESMDVTTIDESSVRMYACERKAGGCDTDTNLASDFAFDGDRVLRIYDGGTTPLTPNSWYTVELDTSITSFNIETVAGTNVEIKENLRNTARCSDSVAFCFDFQVSETGARCTIENAYIVPGQKNTRVLGPLEARAGQLQQFQVYGQADQECIALDVSSLDWVWGAYGTLEGVIAFPALVDININDILNPRNDIRTLDIQNDVVNQPVKLTASVVEETFGPVIEGDTVVVGVTDTRAATGTADIFITLGDPAPSNYWPNCAAACTNATLGVTFNRNMVTTTFDGAVSLYICDDENCDDLNDSDKVSGTYINQDSISPRGFVIVPGTTLVRDTWYQVALDSSIASIGGYNTDGTIINGDTIEAFDWRFKTKPTFDGCFIESITIEPNSYIARAVGEQNVFSVYPYGTPDVCSPYGQQLNPWDYDWSWTIENEAVATLTTFAQEPISALGCTESCLPLGSIVSLGSDATYVCGNGAIEPGETCDIGMPGEVTGGTEAGTTCTYSCQRPGNSNTTNDSLAVCGDGRLDHPQSTDDGALPAGEECDDGNSIDGDGCSAQCTNEGSTFELPTGEVEGSVCNGELVTLGEECEIIDATTIAIIDASGAQVNVIVSNAATYCTDTCLMSGTAIAAEWCELEDNAALEACAVPTTVCGNGVLERGEQCEYGDGATTLVRTGVNTVGAEAIDPSIVCSSQCIIQNACDYRTELPTNATCEAGTEGCSSSCTLTGSSVLHNTPSICGDGRSSGVGIGEYEYCEVPTVSTEAFRAPVQITTAVGDDTDITVETGAQQTEITAAATRYIALDGETITSFGADDVTSVTSSYYLQCGYTEYVEPEVQVDNTLEYNNCHGSDGGYGSGVAENSCCYPRPIVAEHFPTEEGLNVCRNTFISATIVGDVIDDETVRENVILAERTDDTCEELGLEDITNELRGVFGIAPVSELPIFIEIILDGFDAIFGTDDITIDEGNWCDSGIRISTDVTYIVGEEDENDEPVVSSTISTIEITIQELLKEDTDYSVLLRGTANGITNYRGIPIQARDNTSMYDGWVFQTGEEICKIASVDVVPESHIFEEPFTTSSFQMVARTARNESIVPITGVYAWVYDWYPKENTYFDIPVEGTATSDMDPSADIGIFEREGTLTAFGKVSVVVDADPSTSNQVGKDFLGTTDLYGIFCSNIWPARTGDTWSPYRDINTLEVDEFNYQFAYCADAGLASTRTDDLPFFTLPPLEPSLSEDSNGVCTAGLPDRILNNCNSDIECGGTILVEETCVGISAVDDFGDLFPSEDDDLATGICSITRGECFISEGCNIETAYTGVCTPITPSDEILDRKIFLNDKNDDALGVQIFKNVDRQTARKWYGDRFNDESTYQSLSIDGYDAITNGFNYFINALNVQYTDAGAVSNIYNNVYQFTINEAAQPNTQEAFDSIINNLRFNTNVSDYGYCLVGDLERRDTTADIGAEGGSVACSNDFDCRLPDGSEKPGLSGQCSNNRTALLRDFDRLQDVQGIQDNLEIYRNNTGAYPSMNAGSYYAGYTTSRWPSWGRLQQEVGILPTDPIDEWTSCGDILSIDQQTCWDAASSTYNCPAFSSVYEYSVENSDATDYTFHAPLEYLHPTDPIVDSFIDTDHFSDAPWCSGTIESPIAGTCGDGIVQGRRFIFDRIGEDCDPPGEAVERSCGTGVDAGFKSQVCSSDCQLPLRWSDVRLVCTPSTDCGNGVVESGEDCDDGRGLNGTYGHCSDSCEYDGAAFCGNGDLDAPDELCDYEEDIYGRGVCQLTRRACIISSSGNYCSDGSTCIAIDDTNYGEGPNGSCTVSCIGRGDYCGDGIVQKTIDSGTGDPYEQCDDGNTDNEDGCRNNCFLDELIARTAEDISGRCGDGVVQSPNSDGVEEVCDLLFANNGERPTDIPYGESVTYCSADCREILTADPVAYCGDAIVQENEQCDVSAEGTVLTGVGYCNENPGVSCRTFEDCPLVDVATLLGETIESFDSCITELSCAEKGAYQCNDNCQTLINDCTSCGVYSFRTNTANLETELDVDRWFYGERHPEGAVPKLALLNPLIAGNTNYKDVGESLDETIIDGSAINDWWGKRKGRLVNAEGSFYNLYLWPNTVTTNPVYIGYTNFTDQYTGSINEGPPRPPETTRTREDVAFNYYNYMFFYSFVGGATDRDSGITYNFTQEINNTLETSPYCAEDYKVVFNSRRLGEARHDNSKDTNALRSAKTLVNGGFTDAFTYTVNGERSTVENTIVTSPAVPKQALRIVVRSKRVPGERLSNKSTFVTNIYHSTLDNGVLGPRIGYDVALVASATGHICDNMVRTNDVFGSTTGETFSKREEDDAMVNKSYTVIDGETTINPTFHTRYWWPKWNNPNACHGFGGNENGVFVHGIGNTENAQETIHSMTIDAAQLVDGSIMPVYITSVGSPIQPYQNRIDVVVEIYEYHEEQVPGYSLYKPTQTFTLSAADRSSNPLAPFWHVFNLMPDNEDVGYTLEAVGDNDQGSIETRFCDIQAAAEEPCS